jgi:hypothetical protein
MLRLSNGDGMTSARAREQRIAHRRVNVPEPSNPRRVGYRHVCRSGHHQPCRAAGSSVARKIVQQRLAAFVRIDPSEVNDERIRDAQRVQPCVIGSRGRIDSAANHGRRRAPGDAGPHQLLLFLRQKQVAGRTGKVLGEQADVNSWIVFGRWHQHGAIRGKRKAEKSIEIAIRPEQQPIVIAVMALDELEQVRRDRAILAEPRFFLSRRCAAREHPLADVDEPVQIPLARNRKSADSKRSQPRFTGGVMVLPGHVIFRARCQDGDVVRRGEMFRDETTVVFGSAGDVGTEAVDHARQLH